MPCEFQLSLSKVRGECFPAKVKGNGMLSHMRGVFSHDFNDFSKAEVFGSNGPFSTWCSCSR
jgi:hypothetical protein